ncbi:MAG: hypothetical protein QXR97_05965 [Thermoproteota archaeon]
MNEKMVYDAVEKLIAELIQKGLLIDSLSAEIPVPLGASNGLCKNRKDF